MTQYSPYGIRTYLMVTKYFRIEYVMAQGKRKRNYEHDF